MSVRYPKVGDVIQFELPTGRYGYGRVLRDAAVAFYVTTSDDSGHPPIGERDYRFVVGVYRDVVRLATVVGHDPSVTTDEDWPSPAAVRDVITGHVQIYERGVIREATPGEPLPTETASVWDYHNVIDRFMGVRHAPN
jgi:hypothetical protein